MIDITKSYKTSGGRKVRLISDKGSSRYPIVGFVENECEPRGWTKDGKIYYDGSISAYDLVEVKTEKYLKSIRQILEEFPEAFFDEDGDLDHESWEDLIGHKMFRYFGKPLSDADLDYTYIPEWIEEREVDE